MIKVPKSVRVNTGEQETVRPTIEGFITEVYDTLVDRLNLEKGSGMHLILILKQRRHIIPRIVQLGW